MTAIIVGALVLVAVVWFLQLKQNKKIWYPVPFQKGAAYVTIDRIVGDFDTVEKDTVLIYESTGFSRYDGYIGFFFSDSEGKKRRWDIRDGMNPAVEAKKVFAAAPKKG